MGTTSVLTRGATGVIAAGATALTAPEIAALTVIVGGTVVVGASALMLVGWLTGYGASFRANRDGFGFNVGPGTQPQA